MKKNLLFCFALLFAGVLSVNAQREEWNAGPFKHLSLGIGAGTAGVDIELATTLGNHFQLRAGVSALPFTYTGEFELDNDLLFDAINEAPNPGLIRDELRNKGIDLANMPDDAELDAELGLMNGKVLLDIYPFKKATFRITAGAYFGKDKLINVEGRLPNEIVEAAGIISQYGGEYTPGIHLGENFIGANELGNVDAFVKINKVKPYVGIGFGRAVPKHRLGLDFDLGVMFHGTPKIDSSNGNISDALNDELESSGLTDILEEITIYPVMSLRLVGRIF